MSKHENPSAGQELAARDAGELLIGGTFAIYADGGGGLVMVTDVEGRGVEKRTIPRAMVQMFTGKGPLGAMAAKMFGGAPPVAG